MAAFICIFGFVDLSIVCICTNKFIVLSSTDWYKRNPSTTLGIGTDAHNAECS